MKLQLLLPILLLAITSSCSSDNEKTLENELDNTRYYVKYECELNTQHLNIVKTISFLTGAGLIASTIPLTENGNTTAAKICLISGCIVIVAGIAELIFIKRK